MAEFISERDVQSAIARLRPVLSPQFRREFFGRERLDRLERVVGGAIGPHFLLDLIVHQEGPQVLARQPERIGRARTSIRKLLLESLADPELVAIYQLLRGNKAKSSSREVMVRDLSEFNWHRGSTSALRLTRALGLPDSYAGVRETGRRDASYEIEPLGAIPPLKPFQRGILRELRSVMAECKRAMVSSFTGTGKTRMGMEFVIENLQADDDKPVVLWVAQKAELLEQACDSIDQLWPSLSQTSGQSLQVFRYWEGQKFDDELPERPTLVVATAQQILSRLGKDSFLAAALSRARLLVIDEAHHALAKGHRALIEAYEGARAPRSSRVLGLTATPGRSNLIDPHESALLAELFGHTLIVPAVAPTGEALRWFQSQGFLSELDHQVVEAPSQVRQTLGKIKRSIQEDQSGYKDFTSEFLGIIGEDSQRNRSILEELSRLHHAGRQMLVFCCNISQAEILCQSLLVQGIPAGMIHHKIDPRDRRHTILQFRRGELRTLVNVEVLTTGFDAPRCDTIVMCRPTLSRVLYEQMVGRGMRGPGMGGTAKCEIVDFTSNFGTFEEPMAWEAFWDDWHASAKDGTVATWSGWKIVAAVPEEETGAVN